jgi:Hypothetical glycosyl hydrolase family 15
VQLYATGDPEFDHWTASRDCRRFYRRYHRMRLYPPFADRCARRYRGGLGYEDVQAIYRYELDRPRGETARQARQRRRLDSWILRDARGRRLYVPFDCDDGRCPQYAADIGNPAWRRHYVRKVREWIGEGYRGIFVDDVNWNLNASDGFGRPAAPIDPRTGREMTAADWRRYMARFVERLRAVFPRRELMVNSVWWRSASGLDDPAVRRGVAAATTYEMERGTDDVFEGQSYDALLAAVDAIHALGTGVNLDGYPAETRARAEFELATYLLVSNGRDSVHASYGSCPGAGRRSPCEEPFWQGWRTDLGPALGPRTVQPDGVHQRAFLGGLVLVNPPGAPRRTVFLGAPYADLDGTRSAARTLHGGEAVVLRR